jgi:F0F1-type ATP synthase membrane subunit b/b'
MTEPVINPRLLAQLVVKAIKKFLDPRDAKIAALEHRCQRHSEHLARLQTAVSELKSKHRD